MFGICPLPLFLDDEISLSGEVVQRVDLTFDLLLRATMLREGWTQIQGKSAAGESDIRTAEDLAMNIQRTVGLHASKIQRAFRSRRPASGCARSRSFFRPTPVVDGR